MVFMSELDLMRRRIGSSPTKNAGGFLGPELLGFFKIRFLGEPEHLVVFWESFRIGVVMIDFPNYPRD